MGDIGPKFGFEAKDNGYAIFNHVSIPRTNVLSRYLEVEANGDVNQKGNPLVLYSIMMFTRVQVTSSAGFLLAKAVLIAARYAIVRTQFRNDRDKEGKPIERRLLDYQTHSQRIVENLANLFVMQLTMRSIYKLYDQMINKIQKKQNFSLMAPMHTILAGLKSLFCHLGYEGVKTMRECCGGAGFHKFAGFGLILSGVSPLVTLEGDSVVMNL